MADHIAPALEYMPCPIHGEHDAWIMVRWAADNKNPESKVLAMCMKCNVEAMFAAGVTVLEVLPNTESTDGPEGVQEVKKSDG